MLLPHSTSLRFKIGMMFPLVLAFFAGYSGKVETTIRESSDDAWMMSRIYPDKQDSYMSQNGEHSVQRAQMQRP